MKHLFILALLSLITAQANAATVATPAVTVDGDEYSYKCTVVAGSMRFSNGMKSEAYARFSDLQSINIYKERGMLNGAEAVPGKDFEFKKNATLFTTAQKNYADRMYPAEQTLRLLKLDLSPVTNDTDLETEFVNEFKHAYKEAGVDGEFSNLEVTIWQNQEADHLAYSRTGKLRYEFKAPKSLPAPVRAQMDGTAEFDLECAE